MHGYVFPLAIATGHQCRSTRGRPKPGGTPRQRSLPGDIRGSIYPPAQGKTLSSCMHTELAEICLQQTGFRNAHCASQRGSREKAGAATLSGSNPARSMQRADRPDPRRSPICKN